MYKSVLLVGLCGWAGICFVGADEPKKEATMNPAEKEFTALYESYETRYRPLAIEAERTWWESNVTGADADFQRRKDADKAMVDFHSDSAAFAKLKSIKESNQLTDSMQKRLLELMYRNYLPYQADPKINKQIVELSADIEQIFNAHRSDLNGKPATENDVRDVLGSTKDSHMAEQAWKGYMAVGVKSKDKLAQLVKLRNQLAKQLGFDNFYSLSMHLQEIDENQMIRLFDELDDLTRKPFEQLKAEIDAKRAANFGIKVEDLRPWHYGDLFFQEAPPVETVDWDAFYKDKDLLAMARTYYNSIDMDVDGIVKRSDLYEKPGKSPHAFSSDIDRAGDIRVLCNLKPNAYWADTIMHELGHSVFDEYIDRNLPFVLRQASHAMTTEGMALMFGTFSKNREFLTRVLNVPENQAEKYAQSAQNSLRMEKIVFSRWAQVMVRFEREMYRNPDQDLNKLWWNLKKKYQLLNPPDDMSGVDYGAKNHVVTTPAYYHNYMMGDLVASQVRHYICANILKTADVKNACFFGQKAAGQYLKGKVFSPGSKMPWVQHIEAATGEPLTAKYFTEQYINP